jgi:mediator of RNA polymerase II transcription subunit 25
MREDSAKLGIGQTNSGGIRGMAALEGLVAAIEVRSYFHMLGYGLRSSSQLFDALTQTASPSINHIFHVAASAPDTSIHPRWNASPSLDAVTWDDLSTELKKVCLTDVIDNELFTLFIEKHQYQLCKSSSESLPLRRSTLSSLCLAFSS